MPSSFAASRPAPISSGGCGSKCRATMTPPRGLTRAYGTAVLKLPGATIRPGVFYLVTNDRYGLGRFIDEALVDKWTLYAVGQYCDERVPDGFGGWGPRFSC